MEISPGERTFAWGYFIYKGQLLLLLAAFAATRRFTLVVVSLILATFLFGLASFGLLLLLFGFGTHDKITVKHIGGVISVYP